MTRTFETIDELRAAAGQHLGYSRWLVVDQDRIDIFADATGDHQWIHVDPERAERESPFGSTVAHGFLTLALVADLAPEIYEFTGARLSVNYGLDRLRFPAPVPVGSKVRLGVELRAVEAVGDDCHQCAATFTVEVEDGAKPACVAEMVFRYYT